MPHLANPRLTQQTPLHEITAQHGERGLRQRLVTDRPAAISQQEGR